MVIILYYYYNISNIVVTVATDVAVTATAGNINGGSSVPTGTHRTRGICALATNNDYGGGTGT